MRGCRCFAERGEWHNQGMYRDPLAEQGRFEISAGWQLGQRAVSFLSANSKVIEHTYRSVFVEAMEGR